MRDCTKCEGMEEARSQEREKFRQRNRCIRLKCEGVQATAVGLAGLQGSRDNESGGWQNAVGLDFKSR